MKREIRKAEKDAKRTELESKLNSNRDALKKYGSEYKQALNSYKQERSAKRIKRSADAIDAVFSTLCDYGQSLRALKKNERFTLMVKGGVDSEGAKATLVYVIEQKALKSCSDGQKLRTKAIHYSL